jgi:hypothetical protein
VPTDLKDMNVVVVVILERIQKRRVTKKVTAFLGKNTLVVSRN